MIRPLAWTAAAALAALALGCEDRYPNEQHAQQTQHREVNAERDIARIRAQERKDIADVQKRADDRVAEKQADLTRAQNEERLRSEKDAADQQARVEPRRDRDANVQRLDHRAALPSEGTVRGELLKGPVALFRSDIRLRDTRGSEQILKTDRDTHVTRNGRDVQLNDLPEGTEVRASFVIDDHDNRIARDVEILAPAR